MRRRLEVSAGQVAAAKLAVKRARARRLPVDPAIQAIAEARRERTPQQEFVAGSSEGRA